MLVREAMTRECLTVPEDATVNDALLMLHALDIRHLPVVNDKRILVGMISDRDLRSLPLPPVVGAGPDPGRTPLDVSVGAVMCRNVVTVSPDSSVRTAGGLMLEHKVGALPVVDTSGHITGILSYADILKRCVV